jgi:hypothetical protein
MAHRHRVKSSSRGYWSLAHADVQSMVRAVSAIADVHVDTPDRAHISDLAPDSRDYGSDTSPGSAWDEQCDELLAAVRRALPAGWVAEWADDDVIIARA